MNNNGWITDRRPIEHYESYVYDSSGHVCHRIKIANGEPWKPIPKCEPYVKPKRFEVRWEHYGEAKGCWMVFTTAEYGQREVLTLKGLTQNNDEHRRAAERIAAIYEEEMP